ncbi:MAG TPA: hypothetical protein VFE50_03055 [Cyclobacteriaceae bacterium]|nr:hypothetical protein [Cyclobacteriaceae bacterium]
MVKSVLLPTDFSIRSLHIMRYALEENPDCELRMFLVTGMRIPGSITELLFFSRKELIKKLQGQVFIEACQIIRNKYQSHINEVHFEIFTGMTQGAFNVFLEGNGIQHIYIPANKLHYKRPCFDPVSFMRNSKLPRNIVSWVEQEAAEESNYLGDLFKSWA